MQSEAQEEEKTAPQQIQGEQLAQSAREPKSAQRSNFMKRKSFP